MVIITPHQRDKLLTESQIKAGRDEPLIVLKNGKWISILTEEQRKEIAQSLADEGQVKAGEYFLRGIEK